MLRDSDQVAERRGPAKGVGRRGFGRLRRERSGRWSAAYIGPDGALHRAPTTYSVKIDAEGWLASERRLIDLDTWLPPLEREEALQRRRLSAVGPDLATYSQDWVTQRMVRGRPLKPRTQALYRRLLEKHIVPTLGGLGLKKISTETVNAWYRELDASAPTQRAHAYSLLQAILTTAVEEKRLVANPCQIKHAGQVSKKREFEPLTPAELVALAQAMPDRFRLMVLLAGWAGLRFGELAELRRKDLSPERMQVKVLRGVVRAEGQVLVSDPKSEAGRRTVHIPPHLKEVVVEHLRNHAEPGQNGLLFPARHGGHLAPSTLYGAAPRRVKTPEGVVWEGGTNFYRARAAIGRPDLRFHDLRHSAAVLAAMSGATLAELMARLGHSTPAAAMRYQHAARGRDEEIARRLSAMVSGE